MTPPSRGEPDELHGTVEPHRRARHLAPAPFAMAVDARRAPGAGRRAARASLAGTAALRAPGPGAAQVRHAGDGRVAARGARAAGAGSGPAEQPYVPEVAFARRQHARDAAFRVAK